MPPRLALCKNSIHTPPSSLCCQRLYTKTNKKDEKYDRCVDDATEIKESADVIEQVNSYLLLVYNFFVYSPRERVLETVEKKYRKIKTNFCTTDFCIDKSNQLCYIMTVMSVSCLILTIKSVC